ncbi:MAG: dTDP-4-dehydrorhamnose 3,5-epimerase [Desulfobacterales bacterium]|nr:dTDP-4-dehydrorhamnose 3,5-epimerase [Desulfobacterales bacterium]
MKILPTTIDGPLIIEPDVYGDHRGYFMETYRQERLRPLGIDTSFIQDNLSFSVKNTLRGLHYQIKKPQAKLVQVVTGEVYDVAVDIRQNSPTFGQWVGALLSEENKRQFYVPEGFAHGFCVMSESAHFVYKCSNYYNPQDEGGIMWSDPDIGIEWPVKNPVISEKDLHNPCFKDLSENKLPGEKS